MDAFSLNRLIFQFFSLNKGTIKQQQAEQAIYIQRPRIARGILLLTNS